MNNFYPYTFLCGIHHLNVKEDLGEGLALHGHKNNPELPPVFITNNRKKIQSFLSKDLATSIGYIEYNHLRLRYPLVAFTEGKFDSGQYTSVQYLDLHLQLLNMYFLCLWLKKDNAADFDLGYILFNTGKEIMTSSNNLTSTTFDCSGSRNVVDFTSKELADGAAFLEGEIQILHGNRPVMANASSVDKITLALYFIQAARAANDLGIKAVSYCSALETLFSTGDNTELSHKLSERIAKFLQPDLQGRMDMYKAVKKIYEVRSKVVHGAYYKASKVEELSARVTEADQICRRVMKYALVKKSPDNIFEMANDQLEKYFLEMIFS